MYHLRMVRTQIQLEDSQHHELKQVASQRGVSVARLIREGVDQILADAKQDQQWTMLWDALDSLEKLDGPSDASTNHDQYLAEAYAGE